LLILALAFAGLVWRAQIDPFTLGITVILIWSIVALSWYGSPETLLLHACLWTGIVVIAVGLGLERALSHWQHLGKPLTLFLAIFVSALITRNWMYLVEVTRIPGQ
jgi:EamA domain-containing membrane protein RarD